MHLALFRNPTNAEENTSGKIFCMHQIMAVVILWFVAQVAARY
jgi:hypothetical protein